MFEVCLLNHHVLFFFFFQAIDFYKIIKPFEFKIKASLLHSGKYHENSGFPPKYSSF